MQLKLSDIRNILYKSTALELDNETLQGVADCYNFLSEFAQNKVIYGINTGFGPMAQWRVADKDLLSLQYNIIRSHSTGAGEPLDDIYVRAAMIARLGSFLQCKSGVHVEIVNLLVEFINKQIIIIHSINFKNFLKLNFLFTLFFIFFLYYLFYFI